MVLSDESDEAIVKAVLERAERVLTFETSALVLRCAFVFFVSYVYLK